MPLTFLGYSLLVLALGFPLTPDGLRREIAERGADRVLYDLSKQPQALATVEGQIATGDLRWLAVGLELHGGCDAGLCFALELAFSAALLKKPSDVLRVLGSREMVRQVCSAYEPSGPGLEGCLVEIITRRHAVEGVTDPRVADLRDACLSDLAELERLAYGACS